MTQRVRLTIVSLASAVLLAGGGWTLHAEALQNAKKAAEPHPVLQNSLRQVEAVKDRLQKAPSDFGGHKEAAIDALNRAASELQQAIAFDHK